MFQDKKIIRSYKLDALEKIGEENIYSFLGDVKGSRSHCIRVASATDIDILNTWENHFKLYGVPYAIEQVDDVLYLWKERVV